MTPYSHLRSLPRVDLAASSPLDRPLTIYCELTNRCNLSCRMCPESHPDYADIAGGIRTMSLDDLLLVRDNLEAIGGVKSLYLHSLGEPMLNPHCAAFIALVRPNVERICLTTNGTVPLVKLMASPPDYVRVSVYGLTQTEFEETTQSTVDHRRVYENVKELHAARGERSLPYIYVKSFGKFSQLHYRYRDIADEVDTEPTMNWNGQGSFGTVGEGTKRACPAPFYMLNIHSDLRVSVCGVDWSKKLVVGDLHTNTLVDIWRSQAVHGIRLAHLRGQRCSLEGCRDCTYLHTTLPDNLDSLTAETYNQRRKEPACV